LTCNFKMKNKFFIRKIWFSFLFILFTLFLSCTSVSNKKINELYPVSTKDVTNIFTNIKSVHPHWISIADGVDYFQGKISSPKLEFYSLQIDLTSPNLHIVVRGGALADDGSTLNTKVSSFTRDNNLFAGINTAPFDFVSSKEGLPVKNVGIVISDGVLLSHTVPLYDALVFYKDGKAAVINQSLIQSVENIENAIGGFHQILAGGETTQKTHNNTARHPRSAAGISPNGNYLYLLVIDGRQQKSIGATEEETALLLLSLGSYEGINFDGGGSSALALRFPDGSVRVVNTPIHRFFPGQERAVAGCLGVYIKNN